MSNKSNILKLIEDGYDLPLIVVPVPELVTGLVSMV